MRRKKITVARAQRVLLPPDAQLKRAADDPMRLILCVLVRAINRSGRIAPLKNAVAFGLQTPPQLSRIRRLFIAPTLHSDAQSFITPPSKRSSRIRAEETFKHQYLALMLCLVINQMMQYPTQARLNRSLAPLAANDAL